MSDFCSLETKKFEMNSYLDKIALEIRRVADPKADATDEDLSLYRIYAVLLLAKGPGVTAEDVHDAWAAWASKNEPESQNLQPFEKLSIEVQEKDELYVGVIHRVSKKMRPYTR